MIIEIKLLSNAEEIDKNQEVRATELDLLGAYKTPEIQKKFKYTKFGIRLSDIKYWYLSVDGKEITLLCSGGDTFIVKSSEDLIHKLELTFKD
nr:MAG TPA: hypothetical protein [Caudoviricetes sp.]